MVNRAVLVSHRPFLIVYRSVLVARRLVLLVHGPFLVLYRPVLLAQKGVLYYMVYYWYSSTSGHVIADIVI